VQIIKPFVLLDLFRLEPSAPMLFKLHPHSGIARSPCWSAARCASSRWSRR